MSAKPQNRRGVHLIMLAVLIWGMILSIGVGMYGVHPRTGEVAYHPNFLRGAVVMACVLVFLGFWQVMLWSKK
jgi:hypothetical protein